ncbi:MAG TPA: sigma-70 family RNA polymerase sigma factor, partial [Gemmataceae bacterium]|nr:sigma-70 family RNA polymerase sigma factor [Gemmataceae bacterium]
MPVSPAQAVRRYLSRVSPGHEAGDAELLARHSAGDPDAFTLLVRRHGPMVLGACRRSLGQSADADDAFQAVFLALARSANRIRRRDDLGAWLHRVAVHAARRVRERQSRNATAGLTDVPAIAPDPLADLSWREVRRLLDDEIGRLPARLRSPVVACYLDGRTRDEAAHRLGCSSSTLKRRLRRGLAVLRARLTGRGLAPVGLAAAALTGNGLRAVVPDALVERTARLAANPGGELARVLTGLVPTAAPSALRIRSVVLVLLMAGAATVACLSPAGGELPRPKQDQALPRSAAKVQDTGENDPVPAGAVARFGFPRFRTGV